jgi:pseudouridylate synthase
MTRPIQLSAEVQAAQEAGTPIVALESTVISHGLPYPQNMALARELEQIVRDAGATPATIAIIGGNLCVGLSQDQLAILADETVHVRKVSRRDLGATLARGDTGATTVATTMLIAHWAGIRVFATGGIGGVHRGEANDVSADLIELSQTPVAVVCAGAKAILDLPRTLEWLETFGVPVVGYGTDEFPAFYTHTSGLPLIDQVATPDEAAHLLASHWGLDLPSGVLITIPIPEQAALPTDEIQPIIEHALQEADAQDIRGKDITPFLLDKVSQLSGGRSLDANLALLRNNAHIAAHIAVALTPRL